MTLYKWSQTASADATADSTINWSEGQSPSSVNDSARAMMAATAKYRDDIAGAIVTSGSSTAYTVTSYQIFDSLAHLNGQIVAFTPHTTNGATVTLNVDGLGAKPLRSAPSVELPAGVIVQGTPYCALYNASDAAFYLHGFFTNPYSIPIGASVDFWGATSPNSSFVLAYGQAISRTTYSTLFSMFATNYGSGDGSTTFNIPDLRGRVVAGKDDMGGSAASRIGSVSTDNGTITGATLGSAAGSATHVLTPTEMPNHNHGVTDPGHAHVINPTVGVSANVSFSLLIAGTNSAGTLAQNTAAATTGISINTSGGSAAHAMLQPTIIANKLLRII